MIKDTYTWRVTYHDGTQIHEFDEERLDGRGFLEVDQHQIKLVELISPNLEHRVAIPEGATPVFFRRRSAIVMQGSDTPDLSTKHCIGWNRSESSVYLFVLGDGSTLLTSDKQAV